jgi:hypothetical protein
MKTPLRWVYPESSRRIEAMAKELGVHPYDFALIVSVEADSPASQILIIQRGPREWSQKFRVKELSCTADAVTAFLQDVFEEIGKETRQEYQQFMNERQV